ncbi:MAG: hypothetical protein J5631_06940 [Spirochaetaceae bacterium]|nr:hypothetical protein [Spirochaetaceae bacterium]MBR4826022.1 hypothetical protein [Spirochaetaceae bacterium]
MLVVSVSDFNNNLRTYNEPVLIEENGVNIGKFIPAKTRFFSRLFRRKDDTIDGIHRPSRRLKAALRESKKMEKHPEKYKRYSNLDEMWADLRK